MKVYESLIFNNLERIWNIYTLQYFGKFLPKN